MKNSFINYCLYFFSIFLVLGCNEKKQPELNSAKSIFKLVNKGRISKDGNLSRGVAWGDYDNDGKPDLYVANSNDQWNFLYKNIGDGKFKKITNNSIDAAKTVSFATNSQGVSWVDYDNDNDLDVYIVSRGKEENLLFRNDSLVGFTKIKNTPLTKEGISASMACWADFDNDGDLDVLLAGYNYKNILFKNTGAGNFEEVKNSIVNKLDDGRARACGCADTNKDGYPDIYIAKARKPNKFFINLGNWKFKEIEKGHFVEDIGYSYGVSWADYDEDGDLDLFLANFDKENFLYQNDGNANFTPVLQSNLTLENGGASKGHTWGDFDNDGDLDIFIANGTYAPKMNNFLFLNNGKGNFKKRLLDEITKDGDTSAGAAHADYDRDGDLDIFVANWGSRDQINRLYNNTTKNKNWFSLRLRGITSNSYGIGTSVVAYVSSKKEYKKLNRWMYPITGYASQNDYELHFGLGKFSKIDSIIIHWTSGTKNIHKNLKINNHYSAIENGTLKVIE